MHVQQQQKRAPAALLSQVVLWQIDCRIECVVHVARCFQGCVVEGCVCMCALQGCVVGGRQLEEVGSSRCVAHAAAEAV
jgi:hypothetical protein